jgi:hypothetical protein
MLLDNMHADERSLILKEFYMSSETNEPETIPPEEAKDGELTAEQLEEVAGGAIDSYLFFPVPPPPPKHK